MVYVHHHGDPGICLRGDDPEYHRKRGDGHWNAAGVRLYQSRADPPLYDFAGDHHADRLRDRQHPGTVSYTHLDVYKRQVLAQNSSDDPLFCVTISSETGSLQNVAAGTTYEDNKDLYEGDQKVKSEGKNGNQIVTNQTVSVNGSVVTSEVVDTAVVSEAVNSVVYKGTKEKKTTTANDKSASAKGGTVIGSGSGAAVASYGLQFVGNPYKRGGTSLTNGADCSGFTQSVYAKFGISLPRTTWGQAKVGKGVSYSCLLYTSTMHRRHSRMVTGQNMENTLRNWINT